MEIMYKESPFIRFVLSGIVSFLSQFASLVFLVEWMHVNETLSSGIAFTVSCLVNYLLLYYWAFESKGKHHVLVTKFAIISIVSLVLNVAIFWILTVPLGIWYLISQCFTTGSIFIFNYFMKKNYIF